jgi:uncharacterized protein GlcG (DUF336 family)
MSSAKETALREVGEMLTHVASRLVAKVDSAAVQDGSDLYRPPAALRGDGAGIHTLDSAHDKAYTSTSFKNDTIALAEVSGIAALSNISCRMCSFSPEALS